MPESERKVRGRVRILELGEIEYDQAWKLQNQLVTRRRDSEIEDTFLFVSHPPTITLGRGGHGENLLCSDQELERRGVRKFEVERGGDVTFHGPGQQVIYPIVDLRQRGRDTHRLLRDLEAVIIDFLGAYNLRGERVQGKTGVWVEGRKICAIGIAVRQWISFHGLALNLDTDLSYFDLINPCGMPPESVISLEKLLDQPIDKSKAFYGLVNAIERVFEVEAVF